MPLDNTCGAVNSGQDHCQNSLCLPVEDGQAELAHEAWLQQFPVDVWSTVTAKASRRHWVIMVALCNRADHYIFARLFLSIFFFYLFFLA